MKKQQCEADVKKNSVIRSCTRLCAHNYVELDIGYIFFINVLCSASRKESLRITKNHVVDQLRVHGMNT